MKGVYDKEGKCLDFKRWMTKQLIARDWSLRYLSEQTTIDVATLSKMMNGKRPLTLQHAEKIAESLNCSMNDVLHAAGYPIERTPPYLQQIAHEISDVTQMSESQWQSELHTLLHSYEQQSIDEAGREEVEQKFSKKINTLNQKGKWLTTIQTFFEQFGERERPTLELAILGGALLYFIAPLDLIPDYLFAIGYIDDALAIQLASQKLNQM